MTKLAGIPPLVSIVLPCRGRQTLLDRAIASVEAQTFPDWELIVVDDASPTPLSAPRSPRSRLLRLERNLGPAGARDVGLASARGAWAAFIDSDDEWRPDKLARQMSRLAAGPPRALACGARVDGPGGARLRPSRPTRPNERIGAFLYEANEFAQISGVVAPLAAARIAGFGGLAQYEDHYFLLRLQALGLPVEVTAEPLVLHRDDAEDRLGARDDPDQGRAFIEAAGDALTDRERRAFALRCLGAGLAARNRGEALRLAAGELARPGLRAAAVRLALRGLAGGRTWRGLRRLRRVLAARPVTT